MKVSNHPKLKSVTESTISASDLPEGWVETTLDQVLQGLESGSRPKGGVRGITEGIPSIGGEHLNENGGFRFGSIKFVPYSFFERMYQGHIQTGDILIVKDGATTGKVAFVRDDFPYDPAVVNEHVFICRPVSSVYSPFLFYFLFSKEGQDRILENFRGSAQGGINQSFAPGTAIPLAPLAEQKRIVAKVEGLLARVNVVRDRLAKVSEILKRFRQSVLATACSGRLTEDWRERNPNVELARELLKGLISKKGKANKLPVAYKEADHSLNNLPETWLHVRMKNVVESIKYGTSKKCDYDATKIPVLRIPNVINGYIDLSNIKYAQLSSKEYEQLRLRRDDVLMVRSNGSVALVGKTAIVAEKENGYAYAGYLIRLRFNSKMILPSYINFALSTYKARLQIEMPARSTSGVHNINSEEVGNLKIPLPPLEEQREIVRRVEALFNLADGIEKRMVAVGESTQRLTQSILAKAFKGELAPTEAELARREGRPYEPASALLAKIEAQRKDVEPQRKGQNAEKGLLDKNNVRFQILCIKNHY